MHDPFWDDDPFWAQRKTKQVNSRRVLLAIRDDHPTFKELLERTGLSRSVVSGRVKELRKEGVIDRRLNGTRIEYYLTELAKQAEELRRQYMPVAINAIGRVKGKRFMTTMSSVFDTTEENPELLDAFIDWVWELSALMVSNDFQRWAEKHPGAKGTEVMKAQLAKKIPASFSQGTFPIPEPVSEDVNLLQKILTVMREAVSSTRG